MSLINTSVIIKNARDSANIKDIPKNIIKMLVILSTTVFVTEKLYYLRIEPQNLIALYILSTLLVACVTPTYVYGIIYTLLSTFAYDYLITKPRLGFSFTLGFPITLLTMLMVSFVASTITMWMKTQTRLALERENRMQLLYEMNQRLLAARSLDAIICLTNEFLVKHFGRPVIFHIRDVSLQEHKKYQYLAPEGGDEAQDLLCSPAEQQRVRQLFQTGGELPEGSQSDKIQYIPVISKEKVLGVIGISSEQALSQNYMDFLRLLAGQAALALEAQYLSDEQNSILLESEKEKMRSTLLRSISHDLRTPLTGILGTGSAILEEENQISEKHKKLIKDITDTTEWLIRMMENILIVTRISEDTAQVNKKPEVPEEAVAQAVAIVRKRYPGHNIQVLIPEEILLAPMDVILITQVLINLLENSIKNSDEGTVVSVSLERQANNVRFVVRDQGVGIHEELLPHLFGIHVSNPEKPINAKRGTGIGLSICKTIVQAHGGTIEGHNNQDGGTTFSFLLPLQEDYDGGFEDISSRR